MRRLVSVPLVVFALAACDAAPEPAPPAPQPAPPAPAAVEPPGVLTYFDFRRGEAGLTAVLRNRPAMIVFVADD